MSTTYKNCTFNNCTFNPEGSQGIRSYGKTTIDSRLTHVGEILNAASSNMEKVTTIVSPFVVASQSFTNGFSTPSYLLGVISAVVASVVLKDSKAIIAYTLMREDVLKIIKTLRG